jgi:predicted DNA-binding transcriptional regulator AlpA
MHKNLSLISIRDLQARLGGVSRQSIYDLLASGRLPAPVRLMSRRKMFRSDEVDRFIASLQREGSDRKAA